MQTRINTHTFCVLCISSSGENKMHQSRVLQHGQSLRSVLPVQQARDQQRDKGGRLCPHLSPSILVMLSNVMTLMLQTTLGPILTNISFKYSYNVCCILNVGRSFFFLLRCSKCVHSFWQFSLANFKLCKWSSTWCAGFLFSSKLDRTIQLNMLDTGNCLTVRLFFKSKIHLL